MTTPDVRDERFLDFFTEDRATDTVKDSDYVRLINPVRQHFESFIFGNALHCDRVVQEGSAEGQTIVICGAGPSLRDSAAQWTARGDQVWACNSALPWLVEQGHRVTHGFTIDQTAHMVEEWFSAPDVEYLLASTVHPHLTMYLLERERRLTWFHNYVALQKSPVEFCWWCGHNNHESAAQCGAPINDPAGQRDCDCAEYKRTVMPYEDYIYARLFPITVRAGSGLNATTRAIDVALWMGAARIVLLGADCAMRVRKRRPPDAEPGSAAERRWLEEYSDFHADGSHALASGATQTTFDGMIDGRYWVTKPDLAITAVWLERWRRKLGRKKLTIIGDTLPNALQNQSDAFLDRLPHMVDGDGNLIRVR